VALTAPGGRRDEEMAHPGPGRRPGHTLAVVTLLVWFAAEDARQAALLDARVQAAEVRVYQTESRMFRLIQDGAPVEEVVQAYQENKEAWEELRALRGERYWRRRPWHRRVLGEVRFRTGW
jgi:hypothetical protein